MLTTKPRKTALEINQKFLGEKSLIYLTSVNGLVFPKASSPYASNSATLDSNGIEVLLLKSVEKRIYIYTNIFCLLSIRIIPLPFKWELIV